MEPSKNSIDQRLRSEKPMCAAPLGFTERVMAHLPQSSAIEREAAEARPVLWPRLAFAACLLVFGAFLAYQFSDPKSVQVAAGESPEITVATTPPDKVAAADLSIPVITPEQIHALSIKLDDPLERELNNVISDTRQAIQFVALNFLPEK